MTAFLPAMIAAFANVSPDQGTSEPARESDPQPTAPVGLAVNALRWLPKPSIPAAILGLVAGARLTPKSLLLKKVLS